MAKIAKMAEQADHRDYRERARDDYNNRRAEGRLGECSHTWHPTSRRAWHHTRAASSRRFEADEASETISVGWPTGDGFANNCFDHRVGPAQRTCATLDETLEKEASFRLSFEFAAIAANVTSVLDGPSSTSSGSILVTNPRFQRG